jgi:GTPase SAR1 family protein
MYFDASNVPEQVKNVDKTAIYSKILAVGARVLVLGDVLVGKTTLISSGIGEPISFEHSPAYTIKCNTNSSSITEIRGLYTSNKNRGQVWKSIVDFIATNKTDVIWFCVGSDFIDANDEIWHWLKCLSQVCKLIVVRTKCISPSQRLSGEFAQQFPTNPPPVVSLLARDMQLNPKGGGAVVDGYGLDDLICTTEEVLGSMQKFDADAFVKLQNQVTRDEERYAGEEAQKGLLLNSLRSLSGTDETTSKKDSLGDEDFEFVQRPESPGSGFVNIIRSKQARTAVGALIAFAVFLFIFL